LLLLGGLLPAPRNDGRVVRGLAWAGRLDRRPVLKTGRLRWTLAGAERPAITAACPPRLDRRL
jgi:hypothetical protein